jgi:hypothetical protein
MTVPQSEWLAERFEEHRTHLRALQHGCLLAIVHFALGQGQSSQPLGALPAEPRSAIVSSSCHPKL